MAENNVAEEIMKDEDEHVPEVYNSLYPQPSDPLAENLRNILETMTNLTNFTLASYIDFPLHKTLYPLHVRRSLKLFHRKICNGCNGSHQFYIAGGYASYLANLTNRFDDIDIFIHCEAALDHTTIYQTNYEITTNGNVSTIQYYTEGKPKVQFIQVHFNIQVPENIQKKPLFRDLMAMYVLSKFDLPICRVAVILPLNKETRLGKIINLSAINLYKKPSSEARKKKYEDRSNNIRLNPPTLQQSSIFAVYNKFED